MDIRAILFDKDGTLADFEATFNPATAKVIEHICDGDQELVQKVADAWGFDLQNGQIRDDSIIVAGSGRDITAALEGIIPFEDLDEYAMQLDRIYGDYCNSSVVALPGIEASLKRLHSDRYILGIATNDSERNALEQMQALGVTQLFHSIFGADSGHGAKPGPGMVEAFVDKTQLDVSQVLMVGDSMHDIEAGRAAGVLTCGVETGPATRAVLEQHADFVLGSVSELPDWLAGSV